MTPETPDVWKDVDWTALKARAGTIGVHAAINHVEVQVDAARAADAARHQQEMQEADKLIAAMKETLRGWLAANAPGGWINDLRAALSTAEATIQQQAERIVLADDHSETLQTRLKAAEATIAACTPYLKDGETPAECIARNRADTDAVLTLLGQEKATIASLQTAELEANALIASLTAERDKLQAGAATVTFGDADATIAQIVAERDAARDQLHYMQETYVPVESCRQAERERGAAQQP